MTSRSDDLPHVTRFWSKVDRSGGPDACWIWKASGQKRGYGQFWYKGTYQGAHRMAYQIYHQVVLSPGDQVCHNCPSGDKPACCNPKHLYLGTNQQNHQDASAKGQKPRGERHPNAWMTEKKVRRLRKLRAMNKLSFASLAKLFRVSETLATRIAKGGLWRHVT